MSDNLKKYLALAGITLTCGSIFLYYSLKKNLSNKESSNSDVKDSSKMDRETLIKILKAFDKEYYSLL